MTDLKKRVEDDRGAIKKLQLVLPGYRGYRKKEDLRIADSLLREQLYKRLGHSEEDANRLRKKLGDMMELDKLNVIKGLIGDIQTYRARIRHATQEYSGISADYRITENELKALYRYDLNLFDNADELDGLMDKLGDEAGRDGFGDAVDEVREVIRRMNEDFDLRTEMIADLVVGK